jgi:hypothetical protein
MSSTSNLKTHDGATPGSLPSYMPKLPHVAYVMPTRRSRVACVCTELRMLPLSLHLQPAPEKKCV